ncbi:hypothetical protein SISNIDRAFT_449292 [Sistotremastrum niveocremeum HHB9708]|uniref:Uncharacterized protein n=2 Tax=Sistotremastraceae TaxID=3402574 RepID=A0A164ZI79_9AGAM|nr:hypothetical protein SISNIDRAFT_449292 [Sistotremastrum niveocremeum HHB9708]KZT41110.1 hypothetical protein SISSUDRAFT_1043185 [Sistotremastrum suecicum HHB10207 ss-3]
MATSSPNSAKKTAWQNWFAIEAIPIYVIIGGAVTGAGWYLTRLARGPDVIWSKNNPTPWNSIHPDENVKLTSGHHKFEKSWSRDKL